MPPDTPTPASSIIGRDATDLAGNHLGRIVDLVTQPDDTGRLIITAALVNRGPWGRLLGYERDEVRGPWIIEVFARRVFRRQVTEVPWPGLRISPPTP
ncbi:PRC-barrel domain-containing protein [Micromonospora sp. NPDC051141]|uniref:PRC-barrel domain-containing protein n=1 Tax=Micromonospora sp. NPDC051141 TaxID=3364284 RepID=UPI00379E4B2A